MNRKAFTLVELLVVITIIGILTGLVTAAAVAARRRAKIATVVMEVKQLEAACQAYKEKFGEYPPISPGGWIARPGRCYDNANGGSKRRVATSG